MGPSTEHIDPEAFDVTQSTAYNNLLAVIWRHKSLVVLGTVLGVVLGALYYSRQPATYQSSASLLVIKKQGTPVPGGEGDPHGMDDYLAAHQTLMRSPVVVRVAVQKEGSQILKLKSFEGNSDPTYSILGGLTVQRESKDAVSYSNVLNLSYTGGIPEDCRVVLGEVIDGYQVYLNKKYRLFGREGLSQVVTATNKLRADLDKLEEEYANFRRENPLLISTHNGEPRSLHESFLERIYAKQMDLYALQAQLRGRLAVIKQAKKEGRARQALMAQLSAKPEGAMNDSARYSERLFEIQLDLLQKKSEVGPDHPDIKKLKQKLTATQEFFRGISADATRPEGITDPVEIHMVSIDQEIRDAEEAIVELKKLLESQKGEALEIAEKLAEDKRIRDKIKLLSGLFGPLMEKLQMVELTQEVGGFDTEVIAEPTMGFQVAPNLGRILMIAAFLGVLGGFGLAYLADLMDKSFRTPEEIRRRLGVPVIGHIPVIGTDEAAVAAAAESGDLDPRLCTFYQSKSYQAEAFRGLRTALYFSTQGEVHKVIQITSPQASDGKSTLIANLAISIAQSGKRVVLIDADLRKPRLHKIMGVSNAIGLASIISHEAELRDTVQKTPIPNLSLIPCGPRPSNPAELLTSQTFKDLIDTIREEFDFVLIDTPPLLAVSDPSVVAPRVDGVILAIRVSKNGRPNAERAREILKTLGANLLGVVVNGAGTGPGRYGYGYNYRYNYGYAYNYNYNYAYSYQTYSGYYEDDESGNGAAEGGPPAANGNGHGDAEPAAGNGSSRNGGHGHHHRDKSSKPPKSSNLLSRFWRRK